MSAAAAHNEDVSLNPPLEAALSQADVSKPYLTTASTTDSAGSKVVKVMTVTPTLTMTVGNVEITSPFTSTSTNMKTNYATAPSGGLGNGTNGTRNGTVAAKGGPMQFEGAGVGLVGSGFAIGVGVLVAGLFL